MSKQKDGRLFTGDMRKFKTKLILFVIPFIVFVTVSTSLCLEQEPATGSSEVPEYFHTDITDVRALALIVSIVTMICNAILLHAEIKEVNH